MSYINDNILSKEFNFKELISFAAPSIIMMMFISLYTIIDGIFVANYVGSDALAALNIAYPPITFLFAFSIMLGTGGSAIVSFNQGERNMGLASRNFSMITFITLLISIFLSFLFFVFSEKILYLLGSNEVLLPYAKDYLYTLLLFSPALVLQTQFEPFFVSAGKPNLGLILIVFAGITNIVLDYIFIVYFDMGIKGAALATGFSYCIPAIGGLIFFFFNKKGLSFTKFKLDFRVIKQSMINGSSEMVTLLSASVTLIAFNIIMMKLLGSNGVASIAVILYAQFLLNSLFIGFSIGVAPIISYHYGASNLVYLKKNIKMCFIFIAISSVIITTFSFLLANPIATLFADGNKQILELSTYGLKLFSITFLFAGFNIFASALFTALSNGKISALLSFSRTFLFSLLGIFLFSHFFKETGLFLSIPFAEVVTLFLTFYVIKTVLKKMLH